MANKTYIYQPEPNSGEGQSNGTKPLLITVEEDIMALYTDLVSTFTNGSTASASAPTSYADDAAALVDAPTAVRNSSILPRGLFLEVPGFGAAFMPVLTNDVTAASGPHANGMDFAATVNSWVSDTDDETISPTTEGALTVNVTGYRGEQRLLAGA